MNIKEFLMDNYIYIIIVIILTIITIIGFLADKQRSGNKKNDGNSYVPNNDNSNQPNAVTNTPITYQPITNNEPYNENQMGNINNIPNSNVMPNNQLNSINNNMMMGETMLNNNNNQFNNNTNMFNNQQPMPQAPNNNINIPQPVEPMNVGASPVVEPMYQPLSEQKPVIEPTNPMTNISSFGNSNLNNLTNNIPEPMPQLSSVMPNSNMFSQPDITMNNPMTMPNQPMMNNQPANNLNQVNPMPPVAEPIPTPSMNAVSGFITPPQLVNPERVVQPSAMPGFVYGPQQNQNNSGQM